MQKPPLAISIAVCLGLAGCQVFQNSPTWETAVHVRPDGLLRDPDPSSSYAGKLHQALLDQGVQHLVVTYQYHYYSNHYDEALDTRTAIVYNDPVTPGYPWWLKDDRLATPFWLPNGDLAKQLSFYAHRPAEILEQHEYGGHGGSGKASVSLFKQPQTDLRTASNQKTPKAPPANHVAAAPAFRAKSVPENHVAKAPVSHAPTVSATHAASVPPKPVAKAAAPQPAKAPAFHASSVPANHLANVKPVVKPAPATKPSKPAVAFRTAPAKPAPAKSVAHAPAKPVAPAPGKHSAPIVKNRQPRPKTIAKTKSPKAPKSIPHQSESTTSLLWSAPAFIDPVQQAGDPAPRDSHMEKLFHQRHGGKYDPTSPTDRRKMEQLKHSVADRENDGDHVPKHDVAGTEVHF